MLTIVATPLGNLKDLTLRSLEALQAADGIICEDSRRTGILLTHYQIKKPMYVLNDFNEARQFPEIINKLQQGQNLVLVSDAGTPLVADPGYKVVRACLQSGIPVDSLPGPTSPILALTLSGLPPDKFVFLGYLPEKQQARLTLLSKLPQMNQLTPATFIIFISPHKLVKSLQDINQILGDVAICLPHELTKLHQQVKTQAVNEWLKEFEKRPPKGEYIMLINLNT